MAAARKLDDDTPDFKSPLRENVTCSKDLPSAKKQNLTDPLHGSFGLENQPKSTKNAMNNSMQSRVPQPPIHVEEPAGRTIYYETQDQIRRKTFFFRITVILIILNLILIVNAFSQTVTVNGVTVTNTAQITIKGDALFTGGSGVTNNGTIDLTGNFSNNSGSGLFGTSAGTVVLNGTAQNIEGSSVTQFNNLVLQGTDAKTLLQDAVTGGSNGTNSGVLNLGDATLHLNTFDLTVTNSSASAITRNNGFIVSETDPLAGYSNIHWQVANNTGTYVFPLGNQTTGHYLPVTFEINVPGNGSNGTFTLATYPTATSAAPNNRPLPAGLGSLLSVAGTENAQNTLDRWWVMDVTGYTDQPVSDMVLTYRDSEWDASAGSTNTITENTLQAQWNDGSVWNPVAVGAINTTSNTVTVSAMNNYSPFWTLVGSNNPLPVEMLVFDAKLNKDLDVDLTWVTAAEVDNDFFTVERSSDGVSFEPLGYVDGAGNSSNNSYYQFTDKEPFNGVSYYRLKQTDFDGDFAYTEIRAVRINKNADRNFVVFPNPAREQFSILIEGQTEAGQIMITDISGKLIRSISLTAHDDYGVFESRVEISDLTPGMYFVTVPGRGTGRLIKQ